MDKEPEPRARGRTARRVVDWHQGARLLAQGRSVADVAASLGCSRAALARRRKHDPVFQAWMAQCCEADAARADPQPTDPQPADPQLAKAQLTDLRPTLQAAIEKEVRGGNVRVVLWLADRLKLVTPPDQHTPEQELRQILGGLTSEELCEFEGLRDAP